MDEEICVKTIYYSQIAERRRRQEADNELFELAKMHKSRSVRMIVDLESSVLVMHNAC